MSALDQLDDETADVLRVVLSQCDPDLLAILTNSNDPTDAVRERVLHVVADEFLEHVSSPDWEPTAWGKRVDDALGWFLHRFPIES